MKKKANWLLVSFLITLSLVLASCAPATPTPTAPAPTAPTPTAPTPAAPTPTAPAAPAGPEMVKASYKKLDGTVVEKTLEKPQYGGTITIGITNDIPNYDVTAHQSYLGTYHYTNDPLFQSDHARGPGLTGESDYLYSMAAAMFDTNVIATGYTVQDDGTVTVGIRQGVHYHNIPPLNGREVTSDDVVFSIKRDFNMLPDYPTPKSRVFTQSTPEQRPLSVTAPDKWTVVIKINPASLGYILDYLSRTALIYARETTAKEGEAWPWNRNVGNGAWILKDVVLGTSWTFVRNPNYWKTDYAFPENQLPYADSMKWLRITDTSTLMAAIRTAKVDVVREIKRETIEPVLAANQALQATWKIGETAALYYRLDKPELPWSNVKVRQAMQMAVDREAIKRDIHAGQADIYAWPVQDRPDLRTLGAFVPLEELPGNIQELFQYNPAKAKQLLAEAGYPNGFSMEVVTTADWVDQVTLLQFYLAKIGVKLTIDVKESTVFGSIRAGFGHKEGLFYTLRMNPGWQGFGMLAGELDNYSIVNDQRLEEIRNEFGKYQVIDDAKAFAALRNGTPYVLEQAWIIQMPTTKEAMAWWPWLKRYGGINTMSGGRYVWAQWAWIDQTLKKSMGY